MASFPSTSAHLCTQEQAAGTVLASGDAAAGGSAPQWVVCRGFHFACPVRGRDPLFGAWLQEIKGYL